MQLLRCLVVATAFGLCAAAPGLAAVANGNYAGSLTCEKHLTANRPAFTDKVVLAVSGSRAQWLRSGTEKTPRGDGTYTEVGDFDVGPDQTGFVDAIGSSQVGGTQTGEWIMRGVVTFDGRRARADVTMTDPNRIRVFRLCTLEASLDAGAATVASVPPSVPQRVVEPAPAPPPVAVAAVPAPASPAVASVAPAPSAGRKRALVIGNDTYRHVAALANAREDARAMAASLQQLGYEVTLKLDASEKEAKAAVRTFKAQVEGGDEVVVFYSGHGVQIAGANYLLPVDIKGESEDQIRDDALQLQRVLDDMAERKPRFMLAMIDACRDNPLKGHGRALGRRGLSPTTAATGQMIIFSAGAGQQALDKLGPQDPVKNGLFTRVFLREMQRPGVSVDRIVRTVRLEVANLAKSVGHEQVPAIYDQALGEFYFKR